MRNAFDTLVGMVIGLIVGFTILSLGVKCGHFLALHIK